MRHTVFVALPIALGLLAGCDDQRDANNPGVVDPVAEVEPERAPVPEPAPRAEQSIEIADDNGVYNLENEQIAEVEGLVLGGPASVIVAVSEVLEIGGKNVLVPASNLTARADGGFTVPYSEDELENMEEYVPQSDRDAQDFSQREINLDDAIYAENGDEIANVDGFLLEEDPKLIVSFDETLGFKGKIVLIPASDVTQNAEGELVVALTEEQLEALPDYTVDG